jgi:RNA-directed DNA polymerase
MTASINTGVDAAFTRRTDWSSINWKACLHEVKKLQARIAKAVREGCWRRVKALQWLLTHSFSAKALAVRRVVENKGKNTPGVDGVTWSTPAEKSEAIDSLRRRGYRPKPLRRVYIPKSNGKRRPLSIPVKKDLAMQALHKLALEPVAETTADRDSYGFRPERGTADAIAQLFNALSRKGSAQWILEGDIKSCFDKISHEWMLLQNICTDTKLLGQWLKAGFVEEGRLFPTTEGCPQGWNHFARGGQHGPRWFGDPARCAVRLDRDRRNLSRKPKIPGVLRSLRGRFRYHRQLEGIAGK